MNPASSNLPERGLPRGLLFGWAVVATITAVLFGISTLILLFRSPGSAAAGSSTVLTEVPAVADIASAEPTPSPTIPETPVETKDFSASNCVSIALGAEETGGGIKYIDGERDGLTAVESINGVACRHLNLSSRGRSSGYIYFAIDPTFKQKNENRVTIDVEYFDGKEASVFGLHYDAVGLVSSGNPVYTQGNRAVRLEGSETWKVASFRIRNGNFGNLQNGGADFRLWVTPPEIRLRRVTVTRDLAPDGPVRFLSPTPAFRSREIQQGNQPIPNQSAPFRAATNAVESGMISH